MGRWLLPLFLGTALAGVSEAQPPAADPVVAAFRDYRTAFDAKDFSKAAEAAERAWRASEARDGDGGRTAVVAYNVADLRLQLNRYSESIEPARRALALAEAGATGVDPLAARLLLGEALTYVDYNEATTILPPALEAARSNRKDVVAAAYQAAVAWSKAAQNKKDWEALTRPGWLRMILPRVR